MSENGGFRRFKKNPAGGGQGPDICENQGAGINVFALKASVLALLAAVLFFCLVLFLVRGGPVASHVENAGNGEETNGGLPGRRPADKPEDYFIEGMNYYNNGDLKKAKKMLRLSVEACPANRAAAEYLAEALCAGEGQHVMTVTGGQSGNEVVAVEKEEALEKNKGGEQDGEFRKTCELYYRKGRMCYENGDSSGAGYYWEKVKRMIADPGDPLYLEAEKKITLLKKQKSKD